MLDGLVFGDRIAVRSSGVRIDTTGIFIGVRGKVVVWVGLGTVGPFAGQPTVFVTSLDDISIEKLV